MTAREYWELYMEIGRNVADADDASPHIIRMKTLATELRAEPEAVQREFFEHHLGGVLEETNLEDILHLAWDYYPRMDDTGFPDFSHLLLVAPEDWAAQLISNAEREHGDGRAYWEQLRNDIKNTLDGDDPLAWRHTVVRHLVDHLVDTLS